MKWFLCLRFKKPYSLCAVNCIGLSHYISFVTPDEGFTWYFFDSMHDRMNDTSILSLHITYKTDIPIVREVSELNMLQSEKLEQMIENNKCSEYLKRLITDVSVCYYQGK